MMLFQRIAGLVGAYHRNVAQGADVDAEYWADKHADCLTALVSEHMPHGSGFDNGTRLLLGKSTGERLIFETSFHHMDANGSYSGWTNHTVVITPSLIHDYFLRVTGRDKNAIKSYIGDTFDECLTKEVT